MSKNETPLSWFLWHPHQGLWNTGLADGIRRAMPIKPIYKKIFSLITLLDTLILFLQAFAIRASSVGISSIFRRAQVPEDISILYLDVGTHKNGSELLLVVEEILPPICNKVEAYGFEANSESFEQVAQKFADQENVQLIHKALVHNLPSNGKIKLYKDIGNGLEDSIHRRTNNYEEVECIRLSDFLIESRLIEENKIVLLRMNIEGAEYDVVQDLVEHQLNSCIDGYFGMWDDVSKIDIQRDIEFRDFLVEHQIYTFTFNGRDLSRSLRRKCITYHMHTRIIQGLRRLQQMSNSNPTRRKSLIRN